MLLTMELMARGWESKAVEGQKESFESERRKSPGSQPTTEQLEAQRQRDSLMLSRTRVLHDIETSRNPRHRKILEESLAYLDAKLAALK